MLASSTITPVLNDFLNKSIKYVPKVGPMMAKKLAKLNIYTIYDLLYHFPSRYEDLSIVQSIVGLQPGTTVTVKGEITAITNTVTKNGKRLTIATVDDGGGKCQAIWFNQFYMATSLKVGTRVSLSGLVNWFSKKLALISPDYETSLSSRNLHTGRIVPVYPETYGVSSKWLRARIFASLKIYSPLIVDFLPPQIREANNLWGLTNSLNEIHFPSSMEKALKARERLGFDEFLLMHLNSTLRRLEWQKKSKSFPISVNKAKYEEFKSQLPFTLTKAQIRVIEEIFNDIGQSDPANRLLQGDVGSGKTVVATAVAYIVNQSPSYTYPPLSAPPAMNQDGSQPVGGLQASSLRSAPLVKGEEKGKGLKTILMAPTEILARQHFNLLTDLLGNLGLKVVLHTGSFKGLKKAKDFDVLVGTHALIAETVELNNVGLIVIDEQHRFGVEQRNLLRRKSETAHQGEVYVPHFLTMTATPIPRTLALTVYGDLDLSVIDEMPKERQIIKTYVVPPSKREGAYRFVAKQIEEGHQAFILCPFIEPSENMTTVKSALVEFEKLKIVFPKLKLGLLHGRLKSKEKDAVMKGFKDKKLDILVATPVVEVGIDIPNATAILVESAERFGLASLHQLRGRVGRGEHQSYCLLFTENSGGPSFDRLKMMEGHHIGMELAEIDLRLRGSGDIIGTAQSGHFDFKVADLTDTPKIEKTQKIAQAILTDDPDLEKHPLLSSALIAKQNQNVSPD